MTEEEAKSKWCCGPQQDIGGSKCIASACMAWRWRTVPNPEWKPENPMSMYPTRNPYAQVPSGIPSTTDGFCGLAGRPQ